MSSRLHSQHLEQVADRMSGLNGVPQRCARDHFVPIATTVAGPKDVTSGHQISHDCLSGAFGDPHTLGDVAPTNFRILGHTDQHVGVIRQECPVRLRSFRCHPSVPTCSSSQPNLPHS